MNAASNRLEKANNALRKLKRPDSMKFRTGRESPPPDSSPVPILQAEISMDYLSAGHHALQAVRDAHQLAGSPTLTPLS